MTKLSRTDILLLRYAAGSLRAHQSLMVTVLLVVNQDARRKVEEFEALGGRLIQEETPVSMSADCLEIVFKRIDSPPPPQTPMERFLDMFFRD